MSVSVIRYSAVCLMAGSFLSSSAYADYNCTKSPDCASLGYTVDAADCDEGIKVLCPTDTSKAFCKKRIIMAPILYGDGTVSKEVLSDKMPIGIVFDEENKLALALTDVNSSGAAGTTTMKWSYENYDIPDLMNCMHREDLQSCGIDGRVNTMAILNCGSSCGTTPAVTAIKNYEPNGCNEAFCKKGQWFLPSMKELNTIYSYNTAVNNALALLNSIGAAKLKETLYWSSTEYSDKNAWLLGISSGSSSILGKYVSSYVRPVIYYGEEKSLAVSCVIGSLLGGDQLCYSPDSGTPDGVNAVGIVFDVENRLAVALTDVNSSGEIGRTTMKWSQNFCDVPDLTNCVYDDNDSAVDSCGVDGKVNTNAILATNLKCSGWTYAARGANLYGGSKGCSNAFCYQGQWFLPSMRDLAKIYANKSVINASLSLLGSIGAKTLTESSYWSSTEYDNSLAWFLLMSDGTRDFFNKTDESLGTYVRPVVKY